MAASESFLPGGAPSGIAARLASRVAAARRRAGISLTALAARTGLSPAYLSQIESGSANPTVRVLSRLAAALEIDVAGFFGATDASDRAEFRPYYSPAALAAARDSAAGVWDLTAEGSGRMSARLVHGQAADHAIPVAHRGEEFVVVLNGRCRLHVDGIVRTMRPGDACHFDAALAHHLTDVSTDLTLAVVMAQD
jgi:transcriptional regulator with XRE-family HTH domain